MSRMDKVNEKLKNSGAKVKDPEFFTEEMFIEFCSGNPLREEFLNKFKTGGSPILSFRKCTEILKWFESKIEEVKNP